MYVCADVLCKPLWGAGTCFFYPNPETLQRQGGVCVRPLCSYGSGTRGAVTYWQQLLIEFLQVEDVMGLGPLLVSKSVTESGFKALGFFLIGKKFVS